MPKLYTSPLSANGRKALAVCYHLGLEIVAMSPSELDSQESGPSESCRLGEGSSSDRRQPVRGGASLEIVSVDVYRGEGRTAEYLAINPWGKIPTLVDGDLILWESNAILVYLAEAYGENRLWSVEPQQRAEISRWLFWESSQWQPAFVPVLTEVVAATLRPQDGKSPAPADWQDQGLAPQLCFLERHLDSRSFIAQDHLTLADFSVAAMMMYTRAAGFPFDEFARIAAWFERIEALEAWQASSARARD